MTRQTFHPDSRTDSNRFTRRRALASIAGLAVASTGLAYVATDDASAAQVSMGALSVTGDSASLTEPPSELVVTVDGELSVDGDPPEESVAILQAELGGDTFDLDTAVFQSAPTSASFTLSGNVYDWNGIAPGDLFPETPGESTSINLVVRLLAQAWRDGSVIAEDAVQDSVAVTLTNAGLEITTGGTGNVSVA